MVGVVFAILVAIGPATNYVPLFVVLGVVAFLTVTSISLMLVNLFSNRIQFRKATTLLQRMKDGKVKPVEVRINDFTSEGRRKSLQIAIDMGLTLYLVGKRTLFIGHNEHSGVHEHDRWHYVVKAQGVNSQYFRVTNGEVKRTTIHQLTMEQDLSRSIRVREYISNMGNNIDLPEVVKMVKLCCHREIVYMSPILIAAAVLEVGKTDLPAQQVHDLQHHFEEITLKPEFQGYKAIPQELALKICNLPTANVNQCPQRFPVNSLAAKC